jgi:tetratricopeptide (TPR) repeat protein
VSKWPRSRRRASHGASALLEWLRLTAFVLVLLLALALLAPAALTGIAGGLPEALRRAADAGGTAVSAVLNLSRSGVAFLALLFFALVAALWTALRRPLAVIQPAFKLLLDRLVQLIALAILFPLLAFFFRASLDPKHETKEIVALAAMVLVVAIFLGGGPLLLSRLKKVGPLELFEASAPALVTRLSELVERENKDLNQVMGEDSAELAGPPSWAAVEEARRADTLILLFEMFGQPEALSGAARRNLGLLLLTVGNFANRRKDWSLARERLERLRQLLGDRYDRNEITYNLPFKLAYALGVSYLGPVVDPRDPREQGLSFDPKDPKERKQLLKLALDSFSRAVEEDPYSRDALFNRAWVEDELGMLDLAIESNESALKLSPHDAQTKYNLAVSLVKKRKLGDAFTRLETIDAEDQAGLAMLELALTDPDLEPLRRHPSYGARLTRYVSLTLRR